MPFVRIDLAVGKSPHYRKTIGNVIYDAMVATLEVPADDRFQVTTEHALESLSIDRTYLASNAPTTAS